MSILKEIFANKKIEVSESKNSISLSEIEFNAKNTPLPIDFKSAILRTNNLPINLIAEIKRKSPSKGLLNIKFNSIQLANIYMKNGASAISVLTDKKYFSGNLDVLKSIHESNLNLPLLRKDFIFDEYQLFEAKIAGASAALLIVAMLDKSQLKDLILFTKEIGLTPLVEIHNESEMDVALEVEAEVIGINNRNLHDFTVDINTSIKLSKLLPANIITIAESGIHSIKDVTKLSNENIDAILVGESLVTSENIGNKVQELSGNQKI